MRKICVPLFAILWLIVACSGDTTTDSSGNGNDQGWLLVWSDEFDNAGLPLGNKWTYDPGGHGWGNFKYIPN